MNLLSKDDIAGRWNCTLQTVHRAIKRHGLPVAQFKGRRILFEAQDVDALHQRIQQERAEQHGLTLKGAGKPQRIITVKEARGGKRGAK